MSRVRKPRKTRVAQCITQSRTVFRSEFLDVKFLKAPECSGSSAVRGGSVWCTVRNPVVVVPKTIGSAPLRNRSRRRVRGLFRQSSLHWLPGIFIFFVKKSLHVLPAEDIRTMLIRVGERVG